MLSVTASAPRFGMVIKPVYDSLAVAPNDILPGNMGKTMMDQLAAQGIQSMAVVDLQSKEEAVLPQFWREGDGTPYILTGAEMVAMQEFAGFNTQADKYNKTLRDILAQAQQLGGRSLSVETKNDAYKQLKPTLFHEIKCTDRETVIYWPSQK